MSVKILVGDVRERLAQLPDQSVQCVVTSPPYYGLRDYNVAGQIGLEPTLSGYIDALVDVFRDVRRVLRNDGVCFLNLGDSYATSGAKQTGRRDELPEYLERRFQQYGTGRPKASTERDDRTVIKSDTGLKPKDLMMVPARVAIALQDDGWYLRSDIIWSKPNPMPESVQDRPTSAHEHIFLLTKSARYFYDAEAVRTPLKEVSTDRAERADLRQKQGWAEAYHGNPPQGFTRKSDKQRGHSRRHDGFNARWDAMEKAEQQVGGANLRNVWTIATKPFKEAHFATFPPEIPRLCIKAGTKPGDTVLDPFGGSGTTGLVADELGRDAILIDLNPDYAGMAQQRITGASPLFAAVELVP